MRVAVLNHLDKKITGYGWVIIAVLMTKSMQSPLCQVEAVAQKGFENEISWFYNYF